MNPRLIYFGLIIGLLGQTLAIDLKTAIGQTTVQCINWSAEKCSANTDVKSLIDSNKFCEAATYNKNGYSVQTCLVAANGCTQAEYDKVKNAICSADSLAVGIVSLVLSAVVTLFARL
ncbi:hypothetical protein BgiBS90_008113 [Biomphalaria glabrata]|nr:hypothetical protein BgiBS90_008113 [Biomphalaria glabrata]